MKYRFILIFLILTFETKATTIVYYIDNKNVWVGVDSKSVSYKGDETRCKLFKATNNSFFAVTGLPYSKSADYNVLKTAKISLLTSGDIKTQIKFFTDSMDTQCKRLLTKYSADFVNRKGVFTILFFGINDSISYAISVSYKPNYQDTIQPFTRDVKYLFYCSTAVDSSSYGSFGIDKPIEDYINKNGNPFYKNSIPKTITKLIKLCIDYSPKMVGEPINIINVKRNKFKLYSKDNICN